MDKYLEAEKRLAELIGWSQVEFDTFRAGALTGMLPDKSSFGEIVPQWTRDWNACGPLMVEHGLYPEVYTDAGLEFVWIKRSFCKVNVPVSEHPDKDTAVRYAIVQAVIAKLEWQRE